MRQKVEQAVIFLALVLLPTQLSKHFWPDFSFVYSLKIDYLAPRIYLWDLLVLAAAVIWFLGKNHLNKGALQLLLLFILTQALSLILADNIGAGLVRLQQLTISGLFGLLVASTNPTKLKKPLFWALVIAVMVESGLAVFQFLKGGSIGLWLLGERTFSLATLSIATFNFYGQVMIRPYATFPHPNVLAAFIVISLPLINFFKTSSRLASLSSSLGLVATLLSFSRSALIVMAVELTFYLRKRLKFLGLLVLISLPLLLVRFNSAFNFDQLSILRREELAQVAVTQFINQPLLGVGLNNFISSAAGSNLVVGPSRFLQPVHNIFLLALAETGLVGLLGLLGLIGYPIIRLWREKKHPWARLLLYSWATIIFLGLFDHYFLTLAQGQRLLFLIWGLSLASASWRT